MKIYIDNDNCCHVKPEENRREFHVPFFSGKCDAYVEGYRYVPSGESWTREDGEEFSGEMIAPWADYSLLQMAQIQYELMLLEMDAAYQKGVAEA